MRKSLKSIFPLVFLLLFALGLAGCGAASSPPASLPAPVSRLISIGNPDDIGLVSVLGAEGSVLPNAQVRVQKINAVARANSWLDLLLANAWAQSTDPSVITVATDQGFFELLIKAEVGDTLLIQQEQNDEVSPGVDLKVNGNVVRLPVLPGGFFETVPGRLSVTGSPEDSPLGQLFDIDYADSISPASFPEVLQEFDGCPGINGLVVDDGDGLGSLLCTENESFVNFSPDGQVSAQFQEIEGVRFIDGRPETNEGVLGVASPLASVSTFDTSTGSLQCDYLLTSPEGSFQHLQTTRVRILDAGPMASKTIFLALSQFENGSWVLTLFEPTDCTSFTTLQQVVLPADMQPYDMVGFQFGERALVSYPQANRVLLVDLTLDSSVPIPVGINPLGLAVREDESSAFVVNQEENSLTHIDLNSLATQDIPDLGVLPEEVLLVESLGLGTILSPADRSVVSFTLP